jgi:hypothetical protein
VFMGGKNARGEIAIRTLRAAERDGDIKSEFASVVYSHI